MAADGRTWWVRRRIEWRGIRLYEEFEHDIEGGRGAAVLAATAVVAAWVALAVWMPDGVHVPWWLWLDAVLAVAVVAVRWFLHRSVTIVAETPESDGLPSEHWMGFVHGYRAGREEFAIAVRSLRTRATPGHADSPLQPI